MARIRLQHSKNSLVLSTRICPELNDALRKYVIEHDTTIVDVIADALRQWLEQNDNGKEDE